MVKIQNFIKWQDYIILLIIISDLISLALGQKNIHLIIKPFIIPSIGYYFYSKKVLRAKTGKFLLFALLFSWFGDLFLIFESPLYFLLGLSSFLVAHLFYIIIFLSISKPFKPKAIHLFTILFFSLIAFIVLQTVWDNTGDLQIPVLFYTIIISFMGMAAAFNTIKCREYFSLFGALLFIISDSLIAINTFHSVSINFLNFPFLIMLTYISAQIILVYSVSTTIHKS